MTCVPLSRVRPWIAALVLTTSAASMLQSQQAQHSWFAPWVGVGLGDGGMIASCPCGQQGWGLAFSASAAAGLDLTRNLSVGFEQTGEVLLLADERNSALLRTISARYRVPAGPWVLAGRIGVGLARYRLGSEALVNNRPALLAAVEWGGGGRHVEAESDVAYYRSLAGPPRGISDSARTRYHLISILTTGWLRVHFADLRDEGTGGRVSSSAVVR